MEQPESCIIFCNTRSAVDHVQSFLSRKGYTSQALHGDIPQGKRLRTMQQFKQGKFHLLVATDVAARGIDINDLSLVINYDVPIEKDSYIHRIGRTGRAGKSGRAISLVTSEDIMSLYEIEEHIGALIDEAELPSEAASNECSAKAEKWIQSNTKKMNPPPASSRSTSKETQIKTNNSRPSQKRLPQRHGNQSDRPFAEANSKVIKHVNDDDAKIATNTVVQNQIPPEAKKPLLKRIIQRIFGK
jgi:superfamily II DNA/RNA helicase